MRKTLLQLGTLSAILCALSLIFLVTLGRTATRAADALLAPWFSVCAAVTPDAWEAKGNIILGLVWMVSGLVAYCILISAALVVVWAVLNKVMRATGTGGNPGKAKVGVAKCLVAVGAVALAIFDSQAATSIDAVYFAQTHVHKTTDTYFYLVGDLDVTQRKFADHHLTLRGPRFKYHALPGGKIVLYDLEADPGETTDVQSKHADITATMAKQCRERWDAIITSGRSFTPEAAPSKKPATATKGQP
jgi:hypothetical protein